MGLRAKSSWLSSNARPGLRPEFRTAWNQRVRNFRSQFQLQLAYHTLWKACGSAGSSHLLAGSGIDSELFYKWQDAHNPNKSCDLIRRRVKTSGKLQHRQNLYNLWDLHIQRDTALNKLLAFDEERLGPFGRELEPFSKPIKVEAPHLPASFMWSLRRNCGRIVSSRAQSPEKDV